MTITFILILAMSVASFCLLACHPYHPHESEPRVTLGIPMIFNGLVAVSAFIGAAYCARHGL